ncbi:MAG: DUF1573 domain-containing protein [Bacteroidota bacterium]|nr:DUF1573 domain-containing protein [Bacteroidota bacterium]
MRITITTLSLAVLFAGLTACNDGGSDVTAKPIKGSESSATTPEKPAKEPFDPAKSQAQEPAGPTTTMVFDTYEHDFGTLDEGDAVTHIFSFTNTGSEPLILDKCKGSCGCTVPQCPKEPIAPGASGEIEVKFNSKGKKNNQTKTVTINANTDPGQTILKIKAFVNPAEAK